MVFWADHQNRWGAVWDYSNKVMTHSEIICKGLPGSISGRPVKGEWTEAFVRKVVDWENQGATYIPYPNGT
ncbi:MAG: hypothetical protein ACH349_02245 [Candidatus Rhabdochlamydia sp.]